MGFHTGGQNGLPHCWPEWASTLVAGMGFHTSGRNGLPHWWPEWASALLAYKPSHNTLEVSWIVVTTMKA